MSIHRTKPQRSTFRPDPAWQDSFGTLVQFVHREGHARVDVYHLEAGFRLGQWVKIQRSRRSDLHPKQRDALSRLPGWDWEDSPRTAWRDHQAELERFGLVHGHTHVSLNHQADGLRLGFWVAEQRLKYSQGELSPERIEALERIPSWTWSSVAPTLKSTSRAAKPTPITWELGYDLLRRFVAREGHARVPASHREDGVKLGQWVRDQRARKARLVDLKRQALERLPGWTWQAWADRWQRGYARLLEYVAREETAFVPVAHREGDYKLGVWVRAQRMRKDKLTAQQVEALEQLPGWTWKAGKSNEEWWATGYEGLRGFALEHAHCDVPFALRVDEFCLGRWVRLQRAKLNAGTLAKDKARLLTGLPGWTVPQSRQTR